VAVKSATIYFMTFYQKKTIIEDGLGKKTFLISVSDSLTGLFDLSAGNEVNCFEIKDTNEDLDIGQAEFTKDSLSFELLHTPTISSVIDAKAFYFTLESQNIELKRNIAIWINPTYDVSGTTLLANNIAFMGQIKPKMSANDIKWYDSIYGEYINPDRDWKLQAFDFTTEIIDANFKEVIDYFVNRGDEASNIVGSNGNGLDGRDWALNTEGVYNDFLEWYVVHVQDRLGHSLFKNESYYYDKDNNDNNDIIVTAEPNNNRRYYSEVRNLHLCNFHLVMTELLKSISEMKQLNGLNIIIDQTNCNHDFYAGSLKGQIAKNGYSRNVNNKGAYYKTQHMYWDDGQILTDSANPKILKFGQEVDSFYLSWVNFDPKEGDENFSFQQKETLGSVLVWIAACFGMYIKFYYGSDAALHIRFTSRKDIIKDNVLIKDVEKASINTENKYLRRKKIAFIGQTHQAIAEILESKQKKDIFEITKFDGDLLFVNGENFMPSKQTQNNNSVQEKDSQRSLLTIGFPFIQPKNLQRDSVLINNTITPYYKKTIGRLYDGQYGGIDKNGKHYGFQKHILFNSFLVVGIPTDEESYPTRLLDGDFLDNSNWNYEEKEGYYANNLIYFKTTENKNLNGISKIRDYYEPVLKIGNYELGDKTTNKSVTFWSLSDMMNKYYTEVDEFYYKTEYSLTVPFLSGFKKSLDGITPLSEDESFQNLKLGSVFLTKEDRIDPVSGNVITQNYEYLVVGIKRKFSEPETTIRLQLKERFSFYGTIKDTSSFQSNFYSTQTITPEIIEEVTFEFELTNNWNNDIDNAIITGNKFNADGNEIGTLYYKDIQHGLTLESANNIHVEITAIDKNDYDTAIYVWVEPIDINTIRLFSIKRDENPIIPTNIGVSGEVVGTITIKKASSKQEKINNNNILMLNSRNI